MIPDGKTGLKNNKKALVYTSLVVFFWATVPTAFKIALRHLSVVELLTWSALASTFILFVIVGWQGKLKQLFRLSGREWFFSALMGFLNPFIYYLILLKAYSLLPAQQAQPLNLTWGLVLVLISIPILKQKVHWLDWVAIGIAFFGVLVISTEGDLAQLKFKQPLGVGLALGSSLIWAVYWILNTRDRLDPLLRLLMNFCWGSLFSLAAIFIWGWEQMPSWPGLVSAVYVGFFEMGVTFAFWLMALRHATSTATITIFIYVIPFLSFFFLSIFIGEKILLSSIAGAILVVAGIVLNRLNPWRESV